MNSFAALLDSLAAARDEEGKERWLVSYIHATPEPDRAIAVHILAGQVRPRRVKLALIRGLADVRLDPQLFAFSQNFVGDVAETIALLWPVKPGANKDPSLSEVFDALSTLGQSELPRRIESWLDASDTTARFALIKLLTSRLKSPVSAVTLNRAIMTAGCTELLRPSVPPVVQSQDELFKPAMSLPIIGTTSALLMYVEYGRSELTPLLCTFGVWKDTALVPIGRAHATTQLEVIEAFVREHTVNRFGPAREVTHTSEVGLVLEVAFEGLQTSTRRKSGIGLSDPRIVRVCVEAQPIDVAQIEDLERLLPAR